MAVKRGKKQTFYTADIPMPMDGSRAATIIWAMTIMDLTKLQANAFAQTDYPAGIDATDVGQLSRTAARYPAFLTMLQNAQSAYGTFRDCGLLDGDWSSAQSMTTSQIAEIASALSI